MKVLAIESSCDEMAASVVEDGRVVHSSVISSQVNMHKIYGGVVPEIASRMHMETISLVVGEAMNRACVDITAIDAIAVTYAPGLVGSLLVGVNFAKGLSYVNNIPLVPVHHLRSHVASNYITNSDLAPPFLCLIVSGGHSHIVEVLDYTTFRIVGKTRDDAVGEVFDKVARCLGLPYPGGVHMDEMAQSGDDNVFKLPHPVVRDYDFSFSGLKTASVNLIHRYKQNNTQFSVNDMCASFRRVAVDCLLDKFAAAAEDLKYRTLAIAGGVSANRLLRARFEELCYAKKWKGYLPSGDLCGDNAAMVGSQAYYEFNAGNVAGLDLNAQATMSIERIAKGQ